MNLNPRIQLSFLLGLFHFNTPIFNTPCQIVYEYSEYLVVHLKTHPPGPSRPGASPWVAARAEARTGPRGPGGVSLGCAQTPAEGDKGAAQTALPYHTSWPGSHHSGPRRPLSLRLLGRNLRRCPLPGGASEKLLHVPGQCRARGAPGRAAFPTAGARLSP